MTRTCLVTGAASGIGAATVELLRRDGHHVIGADLRDTEISADLGTADGRSEYLARVTEVLGEDALDAVIACAGVGTPGPSSVAVNYFGMVASIELVLPFLRRARLPRAVGIASMAAIHPIDEALLELLERDDESAAVQRAGVLAADEALAGLIYGTSKRAFASWIRSSAPGPAWAGAGIPLNCIAPGVVLTPMTRPLLRTRWADDIKTGAPSPLNGMMEPSAPAELLAFLASEANTHICGQMIFIDSGADAVLRPDRV